MLRNPLLNRINKDVINVRHISDKHFYEDLASVNPFLLLCRRRRAARHSERPRYDHPFTRRLDAAVIRESIGNRRGAFLARIYSTNERLDRGRRPHDGGGGTNKERAAARSFFRDEPPPVSRSQLSHRRQFFEYQNAGWQSLRSCVVVSQGIYPAHGSRQPNRVAELPRHQRSRQYFSQWEADRQFESSRRRMAHVRIRCNLRRQARNECARGASLGADRAQPGDHFRGLESSASG